MRGLPEARYSEPLVSSRLFKAIVGAGIALGATSVACGRFADESNAEVGQPTSPAVGTPGPAATVSTSADGAAAALPEADANTDAEADAGVSEVDGSADVLVDAFCDNTWPTTKGHGGELPSICVDPTGACTPKGLPHHCYADLGGGACGFVDLSALCVGTDWQCQPGTVRAETCKCFGPAPVVGATCATGGWLLPDAGASTDAGQGTDAAFADSG